MTDPVTARARLREALDRMAWIESNPAFSPWLKEALRTAQDRDPVAVLNDLEILTHLLRGWTTAAMEANS